jgi:glycosyltransferase involved in cell wall biosynthesis
MRESPDSGSHKPDLPVPPPGRTGWPWTESPEHLADRMSDGSSWPRLSVVMPSYNQSQYIEESIRSVVLQGYPALEFIIIDGGSTDGSVDVIKKYEPCLAYWVSERDRGQSHAINKGIGRATGEILFWLNSDDLCLPGAFARAAEAFRAHPDQRLVIGQARVIDEKGAVTGELRSRFTTWEELVTNPRNSVRQIGTFFARALFDELGLIDESLHIAMDTELLVRFTQSHAPFILEDYLAAYRTQPDAKTSSQLSKGYEESDRTRGKYLGTRSLVRRYRERSAANWLSLSELETFPLESRRASLTRALRSQPTSVFSRRFWSSAVRLAIARVRRARSAPTGRDA